MHWTNAPTPLSTQRSRSGTRRVAPIAAEPHENVEDGRDRRADVGRADAADPHAFDQGGVPRLRRADRV